MVQALVPALAAAALAAVHLFAGRVIELDVIPRNRWLSFSGGASVAYVFVHLLPEVEAAATTVEESDLVLAAFFERHVYLVALFGFVFFYGLERFVKTRRARRRDAETEPAAVFWLHVGSFAAYNALIGYLLVHRESRGLTSLFFFAVAMGLHFFTNDYGLREHHGDVYRRAGRWVLAGAVLAGVGVGYVTPLEEALLAVLFSFLSGSIVLNVIKEELPEERESQFTAFAAGTTVYAAILLFA